MTDTTGRHARPDDERPTTDRDDLPVRPDEALIDRYERATVIDAHGEKVGRVAQVYLDDTDGRPSWVSVRTGLLGRHETLVPIDGQELTGTEVRVPYPADVIKRAPSIGGHEHVAPREESELHAYYRSQGWAGRVGEPGRADQSAEPGRTEHVDRPRPDDVPGIPAAGTAAATPVAEPRGAGEHDHVHLDLPTDDVRVVGHGGSGGLAGAGREAVPSTTPASGGDVTGASDLGPDLGAAGGAARASDLGSGRGIDHGGDLGSDRDAGRGAVDDTDLGARRGAERGMGAGQGLGVDRAVVPGPDRGAGHGERIDPRPADRFERPLDDTPGHAAPVPATGEATSAEGVQHGRAGERLDASGFVGRDAAVGVGQGPSGDLPHPERAADVVGGDLQHDDVERPTDSLSMTGGPAVESGAGHETVGGAVSGRRVSSLDEVTDGGWGVGSAAPIHDGAQPLGHPVRAWCDTWSYREGPAEHVEREADVWFVDAQAAEHAGFHQADIWV